VQFKKKENERTVAARQRSHAYLKQLEEDEVWMDLAYHDNNVCFYIFAKRSQWSHGMFINRTQLHHSFSRGSLIRTKRVLWSLFCHFISLLIDIFLTPDIKFDVSKQQYVATLVPPREQPVPELRNPPTRFSVSSISLFNDQLIASCPL